MGSVWRAEHLQLRSPVAIKLLDSAISKSEQMSKRFLREAQSAALLRSPHVVQVLDFGVEEGTAFIVMELLQGESLAERIKRVKRLPAEDVIRFLTQVLRAVSKAHEAGIIHRDLKPDNIFICADDLEIAKVLDFGVAKVTGGDLVGAGGTQPGTMIGTPYYMSPEQVKATGVDPRSDLWSIAVIAYECLVGARPFIGEELGELVLAICTGSAPVPSQNVQVPPGFDEWFAKGTARSRAALWLRARNGGCADRAQHGGRPSSPPVFDRAKPGRDLDPDAAQTERIASEGVGSPLRPDYWTTRRGSPRSLARRSKPRDLRADRSSGVDRRVSRLVRRFGASRDAQALRRWRTRSRVAHDVEAGSRADVSGVVRRFRAGTSGGARRSKWRGCRGGQRAIRDGACGSAKRQSRPFGFGARRFQGGHAAQERPAGKSGVAPLVGGVLRFGLLNQSRLRFGRP